jgi:hypothetical protein
VTKGARTWCELVVFVSCGLAVAQWRIDWMDGWLIAVMAGWGGCVGLMGGGVVVWWLMAAVLVVLVAKGRVNLVYKCITTMKG